MKIRKKPIVVDAWFIDTAELAYDGDVLDWVFNEYQSTLGRLEIDGTELRIRTLEGVMTAKDGDVLVKGVDGELYAIRRDIFDKTYDVLDDFNERPIDPSHFINSPPNISVDSIEDMPDGSAVVRMDMDYETLKIFAKKGLYAALISAAEKIVKEHGDA